MAIVRHFWHFRQNRHFQKGPFAISFDILLIIWRLFTTFAIFAKNAIITSFKRDPLPYHLELCQQFATVRYFYQFLQIPHFRPNRHFQKRPFAISFDILLPIWRLFAIFAKITTFVKSASLKAPLCFVIIYSSKFGVFLPFSPVRAFLDISPNLRVLPNWSTWRGFLWRTRFVSWVLDFSQISQVKLNIPYSILQKLSFKGTHLLNADTEMSRVHKKKSINILCTWTEQYHNLNLHGIWLKRLKYYDARQASSGMIVIITTELQLFSDWEYGPHFWPGFGYFGLNWAFVGWFSPVEPSI